VNEAFLSGVIGVFVAEVPDIREDMCKPKTSRCEKLKNAAAVLLHAVIMKLVSVNTAASGMCCISSWLVVLSVLSFSILHSMVISLNTLS
jgi:hypothetical protein